MHHSVSENREWTEGEEQDHVTAIYAGHRKPGRFVPQWSAPGIGYNWLAFPSGRIYYVGDVLTVRVAVSNENQHIVACCLVGDFTTVIPTEAQLDAVRALYLEDWDGLTVRPHRFYGGTACPGNTFNQWIGAISGL